MVHILRLRLRLRFVASHWKISDTSAIASARQAQENKIFLLALATTFFSLHTRFFCVAIAIALALTSLVWSRLKPSWEQTEGLSENQYWNDGVLPYADRKVSPCNFLKFVASSGWKLFETMWMETVHWFRGNIRSRSFLVPFASLIIHIGVSWFRKIHVLKGFVWILTMW